MYRHVFMKPISVVNWLAVFSAAICLMPAPNVAVAQSGTLAQPFAPPPPNAALHYQRALLYLQAIEEGQRELLEVPLWEAIVAIEQQRMDDEVKRLLYQGRLALRSASSGARFETCDFGIDFRDHGPATPLPHVGPMVKLGRILTMRGAYEMSRGNWEEAAVIFFDSIRMGRHMTHQPTVAESVAGLEILKNSYWALAHWATACPHRAMVARAQRLLEAIAGDLTDPAGTVAGEMSILRRRLDGLAAAYPSGPWAELILEELGEEIDGEDLAKRRSKAIALCVARGVDAEVFESPQSFQMHLARVSQVNLRFTEAAAACMTLPADARQRSGTKIFEKYSAVAGALGDTIVLDPAQLGSLFAAHDAELNVLRLVLAVASKRSKEGFPETLESIRSTFGDAIPQSPYNGEPIDYETLDERAGIYLEVQGTDGFPSVTFSSVAPAEIELTEMPTKEPEAASP